MRFRRAEAKLGAALQVARAKNLSPALWKTAEVLQQTCVKEREVVERRASTLPRGRHEAAEPMRPQAAMASCWEARPLVWPA